MVEDLSQRSARRFAYARGAEPPQHYESQPATLDFFIVAHQLEIAPDAQVRRVYGQPRAREHVGYARHIRFAEIAEVLGKLRREHHAGSYGFAVQPRPETQSGFDRVTESVAKVEQCAHPAFALIERDNFCFIAA